MTGFILCFIMPYSVHAEENMKYPMFFGKSSTATIGVDEERDFAKGKLDDFALEDQFKKAMETLN